MITYKCNQCGKKEERSIGGDWEIECQCSGIAIVELTGDYCICDRCGTQSEGHLRQCRCGNTYLTNSYADADEAAINQAIIYSIKRNIASQTKTLFRCQCGKEESFFTNTPMASFCSCDSLMQRDMDLKKFRSAKRWSQDLMASLLGISKRYYRELELKQREPSNKLRLKICDL